MTTPNKEDFIKKCEECGCKIKGAEYYVKETDNKKRKLMCEECYLAE